MSGMISLDGWTADERRLAARQARDMANRCDAAGLHRAAALWRHALTRLAAAHAVAAMHHGHDDE